MYSLVKGFLILLMMVYIISKGFSMDYVDVFGRYHDAPVDEKKQSSSDNGWLYSAIAKKVGLPVNINPEVGEYSAKYLQRHYPTVKNRNLEIPISRDEIMGLAYLGYLKPKHLNGWNFSPYPLPKFNIIKLIKQLWESRKEHRNYFWKNDLSQVYHVAFSVPLQDRHFILQQWGKYNPIYHLIHTIDSIIPKENRSSRNMRYLKTGKDYQGVINYFGEEHIISQHLINTKGRE